jgi:uncharacterized protein (TIGR02145 family)
MKKAFLNPVHLVILPILVLTNCVSDGDFPKMEKPAEATPMSSSFSSSSDVSSSSFEGSSSSSEEMSSSSGESSSSSVVSSSSANLCGDTEYDPIKEFCQDNTTVKPLCSEQEYAALEKCENDVIVTDLCGTSWYHSSTHFCQDNTTVKLLCSEKAYVASEKCENDVIVTNQCGTSWYHFGTHFCQEETTVKLLCGTQSYTSSEFCQGTTIKSLCGEQEYTVTQFCDDRDNKVYKKVTIDEQTWMAENLNFETENRSACYNNNSENCTERGRLYSWHISGEVCPKDWHLPSLDEWEALVNFIETENDCNNCAARHLKATSWSGLDSYGFAAISGGYGGYNDSFGEYSTSVFWWSSDEFNSSSANVMEIRNSLTRVNFFNNDKSRLYSIRCVMD